MNLIVASDIFGLTDALVALVTDLSPYCDSVEIVTPYGNTHRGFADEGAAYAAFQREVGLKKYAEELCHRLAGRESDRQLLLGFSVGASAIWSVSENLTGFQQTKAVCFYSSQIRKFLSLQPAIPVQCYFAASEPAYDVDEVSSTLAAKPLVSSAKTQYPHGFMSRDSLNFSEEGFATFIQISKNRITSDPIPLENLVCERGQSAVQV